GEEVGPERAEVAAQMADQHGQAVGFRIERNREVLVAHLGQGAVGQILEGLETGSDFAQIEGGDGFGHAISQATLWRLWSLRCARYRRPPKSPSSPEDHLFRKSSEARSRMSRSPLGILRSQACGFACFLSRNEAIC